MNLVFAVTLAHAAIDLTDTPLNLSTGAGANVLFNMSVETPMGGGGYNDAPGSIPGCTGRKSVSGVGSNLGTCYFPSYDYIGYFDTLKCYSYSSNRFQPSDIASPDHSCDDGQTGRWSGNFLNWATMTAIDTYILTMTGGRRVTDTPTQTVIERSLAFVAGYAYHTKAIGSSVTNSSSGVPLESVTPFNNPWARIVQNSNTSTFRFEPSSGGNTTYNVRLEVCKVDNSLANNGLESYCVARTNGSSNYYKPEGLIQRNDNKMRFGVMAYTTDNSNSRQGGVLRSNMKYVGPELGTGINNPNKEYNDDGLFITNPDGASAGNSGVINYINKFAVLAGRYKSFDPVSELFYEASRFYRDLGPTPSTYSGLSTSNNGGFPIITAWEDPIQYECQQNFMVAINDAFPWRDKRLPGTHFTTNPTVDALGRNVTVNDDLGAAPTDSDPRMNVRTLTNYVGQLEDAATSGSNKLSTRLGTTKIGEILAPSTGAGINPTNGNGRRNSYYLAGLAHFLNTEDLSSLPGDQTVATFMIDSQEYNNNPLTGNVNQLWLAGKYGGFIDSNDDGIPQTAEWDSDGDGEPDNYVLATEPSKMVAKLQQSFDSINQVTAASNTAVAVNSTQLRQNSRVYQATYSSADWSGRLQAIDINLDGSIGSTLWDAADELPAHGSRNIFTTVMADNGSGTLVPTPVEFLPANVTLSSSAPTTTTVVTQLTSGTASQSTTGTYGGVTGSASKGFDQDLNGNFNTGSVTHTLGTNPNEYWELDLGSQQTNISTLNIYNRSDCCSRRLSNIYVMVADTPFPTSATPDATNLAAAIANADYAEQIINGDAVRINVGGGPAFTDARGRDWVTDDAYYEAGNNQSTTNAISNADTGDFLGDTSDELLYQSELRRSNPVYLNIPVQSGLGHTVILHFSKINGNSSIVDVLFDGTQVLDNYDISAPGDNVAQAVAIRYTATDSTLDLDIVRDAGSARARLSGVEVIPDVTTSTFVAQSVGVPGRYIRLQKAGGVGVSGLTAVNNVFNNENFVSLTEVEVYTSEEVSTGVDNTSIVNYIRGDQSLEIANSGPYRDRTNLLGDIVNSSPISVSIENFGYDVLPGAAGSSYPTYLTSKTTKYVPANNQLFSVIYAGANDGMLHAFQDNEDINPATAGRELFSYIPSHLHDELANLTNPNYPHQYFVDATPAFGDVYISGAWKTILVGSLGAGGRGLYALDITDPKNFDENDVLWEFKIDSDVANGSDELGYVLGEPKIVRLNNGKWGVIVGNGFNSASQKAQLIILDASDGSIMRIIDTGVGTVAIPNGLSEPTALDTNFDRIADAVYAGDLYGNMWKFDLTASTGIASNWDVEYTSSGQPAPLYEAQTSGGNAQPITSPPSLAINPAGGYNVLFGTGKYFEVGDNLIPSSPDIQTFYSIQDNGTLLAAGRSLLVEQTILGEIDITADDGGTPLDTSDDTIVPVRITSSGSSVNYTTQRGWFMDLNVTSTTAEGERVISKPVIRLDKVTFNTIIPSDNPCTGGLGGWTMGLDVLNGARPTFSITDINGDGLIDSSDNVSYGGANVAISGFGNDGVISSPTIISGSGGIDYILRPNGTGIASDATLGNASIVGRQSWQQLK
ncbi:MAG: PilC/PilY family type IV pilus protein [Gammaproteobacteria bacterium]